MRETRGAAASALGLVVGEDASARARMLGRRATASAPERRRIGEVLELADRPGLAPHPVADHRLGDGPDIELGIERAGDALDQHHRLLQQHQLGPRLHVEELGGGEELAEHLRHRDVARLAAVQRLADGAERQREIVDRLVLGHIAHLEMPLGHRRGSCG